MKDTKQKKKE